MAGTTVVACKAALQVLLTAPLAALARPVPVLYGPRALPPRGGRWVRVAGNTAGTVQGFAEGPGLPVTEVFDVPFAVHVEAAGDGDEDLQRVVEAEAVEIFQVVEATVRAAGTLAVDGVLLAEVSGRWVLDDGALRVGEKGPAVAELRGSVRVTADYELEP